MAELYNAASDIIRSFIAGQQLAESKRRAAIQQALEMQKLEQESEFRKQALEIQSKQLQRALDRDAIKEALDIVRAQQTQARDIANLKSKYIDLIYQGKMNPTIEKVPISPTKNPLEWMSGITLGTPLEKEVVGRTPIPGLENVYIEPSEIPTFQQKLEQQAALARARSPYLDLYKKRLELTEKKYNDEYEYRQEILRQNQERLAQGWARLAKMGTASSVQEENLKFRKDSKIDSIVQDVVRPSSNSSYTQFASAEEAKNFALTNRPDPKAPGLYDIGLLYRWIHALDNSVVRYSELELVREAQSRLAPMGYKIGRWAGRNSPLLTPEVRAAIIRQINAMYNTRRAEFYRRLEGTFERAKRFDPSLTRESFGALVGTYTPADSNNNPFLIPSKGIEDWVKGVHLNKNNPDEVPVVLVPKQQGK
ncbi:MAG: hypothetical protein ACUVQP_00145 [Bacteroidales bacterium]